MVPMSEGKDIGQKYHKYLNYIVTNARRIVERITLKSLKNKRVS